MKPTARSSCWLLTGLLIASPALADDYDFELEVDFGSTNFDGSQTITTSGGTIFNSGTTDTDDLSIVGNWYFGGLSDSEGPRARAGLVDRASSLSFRYSRTEQTNTSFLTNTDPSLPIPDLNSSLDTDGDSFAVDFRYVNGDSGWFGEAEAYTSNTSISGFVADSTDTSGWRLGVGKYLFENTTLGLDVGELDAGGLSGTTVGVSVEHLGDLGNRWQYGIDLGYNRLDADFGIEIDTWGAAFSLYPTRDFEFGVGVEDVSGFTFGQNATGFEGFASWFVKPNVRLSLSYRVDDVDYRGNVGVGGAPRESDGDRDSIGIEATIRF